MSSAMTSVVDLARDGYALLASVFGPAEVAAMAAALERALTVNDEPAIRGDEGAVYAARNVLTLWPGSAVVWQREPLAELLRAVLGPDLGLVRVLYFDKPPGQSWALPW